MNPETPETAKETIKRHEETIKRYRQRLLDYARMCLITDVDPGTLRKIMRLEAMGILPHQLWQVGDFAPVDALTDEAVQCWEAHKAGKAHAQGTEGLLTVCKLGAQIDWKARVHVQNMDVTLYPGPDFTRAKVILAAYFEGVAEGLRQ